jgi:RNA polymerase sigma-70 factor (ECF subfamily)
LFAVRNEESALDIVQDAMMKLAEKYGDKPLEELPMLFQRILQNVIRDFYRRQKVRSMWTTLLSAFSGPEDDEHDPSKSSNRPTATTRASRPTPSSSSSRP